MANKAYGAAWYVSNGNTYTEVASVRDIQFSPATLATFTVNPTHDSNDHTVEKFGTFLDYGSVDITFDYTGAAIHDLLYDIWAARANNSMRVFHQSDNSNLQFSGLITSISPGGLSTDGHEGQGATAHVEIDGAITGI